MYASDFRAAARRALSGNWVLAVITGLIASVLNGIDKGGPEFKINFDLATGSAAITYGNIDLGTLFGGGLGAGAFLAWLTSVAFFAFLLGIVWYILGSVITLGYSEFNLHLIDGRDARIESLFAYFPRFKTAFCARFLVDLYTFLWGLLFIIPGIVASYSYAMTSYILVDHPDMTAQEAIAWSKEIMRGNRWRLFCLDFSFIGWSILAAMTLGIGNLWLTPYTKTARAAFYRDLTGPVSAYANNLEF